MRAIVSLLQLAIWIMMLAIFGSIIISWLRAFRVQVPRHNALVRLVEDTADLLLAPIRRALPVTGGGFDFSPVVAILILAVLQRLIASLAHL
jgi:uncharacterized protein YggT (Ycf19 family)